MAKRTPKATTTNTTATAPTNAPAMVPTTNATATAPTANTWQPTAKYSTSIANAHKAGNATQPNGANVLQGCTVQPVNVRPGTARAAVLAALLAQGMGQTRHQCIAICAAAEMQWHQQQGRTPSGVAPAGWLRNLGAQFGPAA